MVQEQAMAAQVLMVQVAVEAETGLLLDFRLKGVPWIEHDGT